MQGEAVKMKRFDKAFKVQAVKMVTEEGKKASEVARSLGIHANVPYNWKKKYAVEGGKSVCRQRAFNGNSILAA